MPTNASELVALLDLETLDNNLFRGRQADTTRQRVFGGQVAAQAFIAAARTVASELSCHSLHSHFLRPGDTAVPIIYDVERIRDGRSFVTRRVVARQHGEAIYILTASFQVAEGGFDHQDRMPEVIAPEQGVDMESVMAGRGQDLEEWQREWSALDVRWIGTSKIGLGPDPDFPARSRLWIRINGELPEDPVVQQAAFTYASDLTLLGSSLVPHEVMIASPGMQAASLDHTIWFHRPFRADEWWLYDQQSPSASGGRGLAVGRVFTRGGTLVASVAQEGLIRLHREGH